MKLDSPATLADWSAKLTGKGGATLAPATKRHAIVRLKSVLAHARKMRWLTYDPSADLESPEQKAITATAADDIWTPEQMSTFLDHVAAHRLSGASGSPCSAFAARRWAGCAGQTSPWRPARCASVRPVLM
jgi:hypothetical protein